MGLFLLMYLAIYGGLLHGYALWRVHRAWPGNRWATLGVLAWSVAMVFGPMASRLLDRAGLYGPERVVSAIGYTWFVLIFWFFMAGLGLDFWNLAVRILAAVAKPSAARFVIAPRRAVVLVAVLIAAASVWGLVEGRAVRLRRVIVPTERLEAGSGPLRVVQISDVHVNWYVRAPMLRRIAALIEEARPHMIVSTGDLIDVSHRQVPEEAAILAQLDAPLGKYAVTGNHEFYLSLDDALEFHRAAGFRMLRGRRVMSPDGRIAIAGVDDPAGRHTGAAVFTDATDCLPGRNAPRPFTLLLKHQPRVRAKSLGRFDLQLSGHTHGGQVFPFYIFVRMQYRYGPGMHELGNASRLYVSRGTGMWGPPMRLLSPPEVTVIDIVPAGDDQASRH